MCDCWPWLGARTGGGYGLFQHPVKKKLVLMHRYAYEVVHGIDIPTKHVIMHTCDNPSCINPDHLLLGTYSDNLQDAYKKGRFVNQHTNKTHCKHGHVLPVEKVGKQRRCKECRNIYG